MNNRLILAATVTALCAACALPMGGTSNTVPLESGAGAVMMGSEHPEFHCQLKGTVINDVDYRHEHDALNDLKNKAYDMGANRIFLLSRINMFYWKYTGQAYYCRHRY